MYPYVAAKVARCFVSPATSTLKPEAKDLKASRHALRAMARRCWFLLVLFSL